jgi:hypothetical protein
MQPPMYLFDIINLEVTSDLSLHIEMVMYPKIKIAKNMNEGPQKQ